MALVSDFADDAGDRRRRTVYADAQITDFIGGNIPTRLHLPRQVAPFDLAQHPARVPQPLDDLDQHRNECDARNEQDQRFLHVQRPRPAMTRDLRHGSRQRECDQIGDQRAPSVAALEVQRRL